MRIATVALVMALAFGAAQVAAPQQADGGSDEFGGLPPGPGQEDVFYACSACHSLAIVRQQHLPRPVWDDLLTWMVEEQGMPPPEPETRNQILDYLAKHFGPEGCTMTPWGRRC